MLQSKQYSEFWYFLDFHVFSSLSDAVRKCLKEVAFLVVPEDTTDNGAGRDKRVIRVEAGKARSIIKVAFWIVTAIILSLCIGQLR